MTKYYRRNASITLLLVLAVFLSDYTTAGIVYFPLNKKSPTALRAQEKTEALRSVDNYDLQGDKSPWVAQIPFGNVVIPFTPMLYTNETWIAGVDQPNIKSIPCTGNIQCNISQLEETKSMLTYNVTGNVSLINNHQVIYTSNTTYLPQTFISGGLGLGISNQSNAMSFPSTFQGDEPIFSIYLKRSFIQSSTLTFGGYDSQYVIHNANFQTLYPISTLNWTFKLTQVATQSLDAIAIIDPNLPYIGVPDQIYLPFVNNFTQQNGLICSLSGLTPTCTCDSFDMLPTLDLSIGGAVLNLPPSMYTSSDDKICTLLFTPISSDNSTFYNVTSQFSDTWILGEPFMDYYYLVFYYQAGYLNVVPSVEVSSSTLAWILLISICSIGFIGVVAYRFWQLSPKKSKESQDNKEGKEDKENKEGNPILIENNEDLLKESLLTRGTEPTTQISLE